MSTSGGSPSPAQLYARERAQFPGLIPRELIVMQAWLKLHAREYTRIDGNVRVGKGFDPGPTYPDNIRQMAIANTQNRIDAVGYQGNQVTLIEVKLRAGPSAVGQLMTYEALWMAAHPGDIPPRLLLVANRLTSGLDTVLQHHGLAYELVAVDAAELARVQSLPVGE